ncbi:MAG: fibronectin-binding autotransporter adhesin [Blastocatellia bacterium]|nr:fibronectin-binding autotransporter adhesin [Blastocatellia bacterium]
MNNSCTPALGFSLTTDQRGAGFARSTDGNGDGIATVDIGAYEVQSILVTNTADSGAGSLRQAITDANASADTSAINFQAGLTGTITLLSALPDLSTSMSINGSGANQISVQRSTAGGTPNFRIFRISSGAAVAIRGLTISNGKFINSGDLGAGVLNNGTLTLASCNIYGNQAVDLPERGGGIYSDGPSLMVNDCNIGGLSAGQPNIGGGIVSVGTLVELLITGGSVVGNTSGGIFFAGGDAILTGVSITNNTGTSATGGFGSNGSMPNVKIINCLIANNTGQNGGGLRNAGGTHSVLNTTISGNTSLGFGGGLDNAFGNTTLTNVTITNNRAQDGGGVFNWSGVGGVLLQNTIVAGNFRGQSPSTTSEDLKNSVSSASSFNLVGSCNGCNLSNGVNNNQVGVADPRLAVLANYGGPTQTHALLPSSPALDAGSNTLATNAGLTTDQRGFPRITNTTVDIGSFESRGFTIAATSGTPQSAPITTAFGSSLVATVSSAFGEPVAGGAVTFTAPGSGASGTFPGNVTTTNVTIAASGLATAPTFTANGIAGGPYNVVASLTGGSPSANFSLTNLKGNQTITVNTHAPASATYNTSFTVAATSSSGVPTISYSSSGACTNVGATFTMTSGTGTCTVKYDQAGDANYNAAPQVTESVTAGKANQTITVNTHAPASASYNINFTVAATSNSSLTVSYSSSGACTNVGATFTMTSGTGTCTVKYDQAGDSNFNTATQVTESVTAQGAATTTSLSSSFNPSAFGQSVTFTATVTSTAGTPTGTVTFKDNGVAITGCSNKTLASGQATCVASGLGAGNHPITADYSGDTNFATSTGTLSGGQGVTPPPSIQFSSATYIKSESGPSTNITVTRTGDTSGASSVNFSTGNNSYVPCSTINGVTTQNCDFVISSGTLNFAAGQTSRSFPIIIIDDVFVEGDETLSLSFSSPLGAVLGSPSTATLTITDNDSVAPAANPLDDARYFVRTHYYDFLGRLPDDGGLDYWTNEITQCGSNTACINERRVAVSNAFFYEQEYQQTASFVFLLYRASFGNNQPFPNPDFFDSNLSALLHDEAKKLPRYLSFARDRAQVTGGTDLAQTQLALANNFVQRPEFITRYPLSLSTAGQFVDAVLATIRNDSGAELVSQRDTLIGHFNTGGRGLVMFHLANDYWNGCNRLPGSPPAPCVPVGYGDAVDNRAFIDAEYNRSFVYSQYSGYLRRDGDIGGFLFWLTEVSKAPPRNVAKQRGMVCSFITSEEYQRRFSSVVTHSNAECGP